MGNFKKLLVKSNYIVEASYKLTLGEQRVIYVLTSMIQPEDEDFKPYKFTVKEFIEILGTKHKDMYREVAKYVEGLRERDLTIVKEKSILKTKWLSSAEYFTEEGSVELEFSPKLKPYLLLLKERFTKLSLAQMVSFNSQYSGRIYELLKQYEKIGARAFKIEDLKKILGIRANEYTSYGLFKQRVLSKAKEEINGNSDMSFEFEEIKTGRKVTDIKFYIKSNENFSDEKSTSKKKDKTMKNESIAFSVKNIFIEDLTDIEIQKLLNASKNNIESIKKKYELAKKSKRIKNIVAWMIRAIKEDYKDPKEKIKVDHFNDFHQRDYDFDELEKKLLGWSKIEEEEKKSI